MIFVNYDDSYKYVVVQKDGCNERRDHVEKENSRRNEPRIDTYIDRYINKYIIHRRYDDTTIYIRRTAITYQHLLSDSSFWIDLLQKQQHQQ